MLPSIEKIKVDVHSNGMLPPNWKSHNDPSSGMTYYYHAPTGTTQWEFPLSQPPLQAAQPQPNKGIQPTKVEPTAGSSNVSSSKPQAALVKGRSTKELMKQSQSMNKDYLAMAREHSAQKQYRDKAGSQLCLLCSSCPSTHIFFPCGHKCVCISCVASHKLCESHQANLGDGEDRWCFCPLCNDEIKKIILFSGGDDDEEKYWNWVNEVKPNLPVRFVHGFKESAKYIKSEYGNESSDADDVRSSEDNSNKRNTNKLKGSKACVVS
jgi:hypothetical protein